MNEPTELEKQLYQALAIVTDEIKFPFEVTKGGASDCVMKPFPGHLPEDFSESVRMLIIKIAEWFGLELREQWVIIDGGLCMPASQANPEQHPQPVSVAWIEESRRGWAKLSAQQSQCSRPEQPSTKAQGSVSGDVETGG